MSVKKTYQVNVEREPDFWIIRVPDIDAVVTQARRMADVKQNAREAIAVWLDEPVSDVEVSVSYVMPPVVQRALEDVKKLREDANERLERAAESASDVARKLTKDLGLTLREAAQILGVSFQRVAQLVEESGKRSQSKGNRTSAKRKSHRDRKVGV